MASEDTELTFIRCPSCRSLVPAIATRCRMCGHQLSGAPAQAAPTGAASDEAQRKSRVRQRSFPPEGEQVEVPSAAKWSDEPLFSEKSQARHIQAPLPEAAIPEEPDYPIDAEQDEQGYAYGLEADLEEDSDAESFADRQEDKFSESPHASEHEATEGIQGEGTTPGKRKRRRKRKRSRAITPQEAVSHADSQFLHEDDQSPELDLEEEEIEEEEFRVEQPRGAHMQQPGTGNGRQQHQAEAVVRKQQVASRGVTGELVGWLVSYEDDPRGAAIEIRGGRFFLGSRQLRASDVVIPHESVSAPHCLVKADGRGIALQDLMSEDGTYVKKAGQAEFLQVEDTVNLTSGDRVRLGEYELLVCLIPRT